MASYLEVLSYHIFRKWLIKSVETVVEQNFPDLSLTYFSRLHNTNIPKVPKTTQKSLDLDIQPSVTVKQVILC